MTGPVEPLEDRAYFEIDIEDGYVRIEQSVGDPPLYTPDEAEELAADITEAAASARDDP